MPDCLLAKRPGLCQNRRSDMGQATHSCTGTTYADDTSAASARKCSLLECNRHSWRKAPKHEQNRYREESLFFVCGGMSLTQTKIKIAQGLAPLGPNAACSGLPPLPRRGKTAQDGE